MRVQRTASKEGGGLGVSLELWASSLLAWGKYKARAHAVLHPAWKALAVTYRFRGYTNAREGHNLAQDTRAETDAVHLTSYISNLRTPVSYAAKNTSKM